MHEKELSGKEVAALILVAIILVAVGLLTGWRLGLGGFDPFQKSGTLSISDFDNVYRLVESEYYAPASTTELIAGGISGFLSGLNDPYSFYIPKEIYERTVASKNGNLFSPGILFLKENGIPVILDVYADSPAASAGLVPGDKILSVNGESVSKLQGTLQITSSLLGISGSTMTLEILTPDGATKNVTLTMTDYEPPLASFKMLSGGIGYLQIYSFDPQLTTDFAPIAKQLESDDVTKLIIDLRNTPGGDVTTEIGILDMFLDHGTIATEYIGGSSKPMIDTASGDAEFPNMKIAILVNNLTASAAEMFTASPSGKQSRDGRRHYDGRQSDRTGIFSVE